MHCILFIITTNRLVRLEFRKYTLDTRIFEVI